MSGLRNETKADQPKLVAKSDQEAQTRCSACHRQWESQVKATSQAMRLAAASDHAQTDRVGRSCKTLEHRLADDELLNLGRAFVNAQ